MKRFVICLCAVVLGAGLAGAQVFISEVFPNPPGSDSTATSGNEHFELRGPPGMSLTNYYLISVEGQGTGTPGKGDINQLFDLSAFSLGANGFLFARQFGSPYVNTEPGATVIQNTLGQGWGSNAASSSVGCMADGTQVDLENSATTILLVYVAPGGVTPTNTLDLDTNNDGLLDLPAGWTVVDSVGIMDGANAAATDSSYGAITFRAPDVNGNYLGTCAYGNIIDIPGPLTTSAGTFYVGRKGASTGSTSNDWMGAIVDGSASAPLNYYFFSASDPGYNGRLLTDMVHGGTNALPDPFGMLGYTPTMHGTRFTNYTHLPIGGPVGAVAVDPRDSSTILFTIDNDVGGGIFRAYKVASGNWWVDSTPVVSGLDRPSGITLQSDGTLWWVHDVAMALVRLKSPWAANTPEIIITNFGTQLTDDDPVDVVVAPANFTGSLGQPGWLVVADRGCDGDAYNALYVVDPATTNLYQAQYDKYLVSPTTFGLGWDNLNAITALPQSGEVVSLSADGFLAAVDGNGNIRQITPGSVGITRGRALAVDPQTGRLWVADGVLDEVWSVHPTTGADQRELGFPLVDSTKTYRRINFHDPGMAFAPNGSFLVVSDTSVAGGGGRLLIFHNEPIVPFSLAAFSITNATVSAGGVQLQWSPAGPASFNLKYTVQRSTNVADATSFQTLAANLTGTTFTDTNAPSSAAFYRVSVKP